MTHKLLQLGHDVQNRRRAVGGSTTGMAVELSWVELCRYKRGLKLSKKHDRVNTVLNSYQD